MLIRVTGILDTDNLEWADVDVSHPMGLSDEGYTAFVTGAKSLPHLDDLEFEALPE